MNAVSLINQLASRDIQLWLEDGQLRFSAPEGAMTESLIAQLRQHKADIIAFLEQSGRQQALIRPVDHSGSLPVSFAQQRLWFLQQLEPGNTAYHIHASLRIEGPLNIEHLQAACRQIIERHAVLRTTYHQQGGQVKQGIQPVGDWQLAVEETSPDAVDDAIHELLQRPFNLAAELPLRCALYRIGEDRYRFAFVIHHIAADGWSLGIFVEELTRLYQAMQQGEAATLPPLAVQYADYAVWQTSDEQQQRRSRQLDYWQQQLAGVPNLDLPLDHPRRPHTPADAAVLVEHLDPALGGHINDLAHRQDSTLFQTMMALFSVLLHRYSRQDDFCIGTPVAGRATSQLEPLIGCFLNVLAVRCEPQGELSFQQHLETVKKRCSDALANQDVPFEQVVQSLDIPRDMTTTPLFQAMLSIQNTPQPAQQLDELSIDFDDNSEPAAQFDLKLTVREEDDGRIALAFEYKKALFDEATIHAMAGHFINLCHAATARPQSALKDLDLFPPQSLKKVLGLFPGGFNDTTTELPDDLLLHHLFARQAEKTPDAIAVSDSKRSLTYAGLDTESSQVAQLLIQMQQRPGDLVGVCMLRSVEMSIALLGVLKAGCAYVPFDPEFPVERLRFMADDTGISVLLTNRPVAEKAAEVSGCCVVLEDMQLDDFSNQAPAVAEGNSALFNVIYTSGSTGKPKGVMVEHRGIANRLLWMQKAFALTADDCVLQKTPYSFDVSVWELFWPLITGSRYHFIEPEAHKDPARLRDAIIENNITTVHFVPSMLAGFLATPGIEQCRCLRQVFCSGEALQASHVETFFQRLPDCELHNLYGPTEASIDVSWYDCRKHNDAPSVPIGKPVDNTRLHILDEHLNPVPNGVAGELYIGGVQLARGYLNRDSLSESTFIANPFAGHPDKRLYKSGDLVRQAADGNILYLGRLDHQVKLRGQRIELGDIEARLATAPGIESCVVTADGQQLVGYYQSASDRDAETLKSHLAAQLPAYMIPGAFIHVSEWPLTPNGKINRNKLPKPDWNTLNRKPYVAPQSDTEKALAAIWQQVLGVDKIGVHDNFFDLGGHSLTAVQALGLAQEQFAVELPLRQIFDNPSIAAIAPLLDKARLEQSVFTASAEDEDDEGESFIL